MRPIHRILAGVAFALALVAFVGFNTRTAFAVPELKGLICHATGSDSNPFVDIIVSVGSASGFPVSNNGHIDANGNPLSGHEQDIYLGAAPPAEKGDCKKFQ
jgi:hypothetical protein